MEIGPAVFS